MDSTWSGGRKASHAVDGCPLPLGDLYSFITKSEENPWWQIDLNDVVHLTAIVIYNQHCAERAATLCVLISTSEEAWRSHSTRTRHKDWQEVYAHHGGPLAGYGTSPALRRDLSAYNARYIRLQLRATDYLHLHKVEIYSDFRVASLV